MLEAYIRNRMKKRDVLLMTHIVIGYPSFEDSFRMIEGMVEAGVDLMELQVPCYEPVADGPVIFDANLKALKHGATVQSCLSFAGEVTQSFDIPFLIMSYCSTFLEYGVNRFVSAMAQNDLKGSIVPDLPPEEGRDYLKAMQNHELAPILIFSPNTSYERMTYLDSFARGFIYCMARKGFTGAETTFSEELTSYLGLCRKASHLPIAVGFGIKKKANIDFLKGKCEIVVIGSQTIRLFNREGIDSVRHFIGNLR